MTGGARSVGRQDEAASADAGSLAVVEVVAGVEAARAWLPVEQLERLAARWFTKSALRRRRNAERDACFRQVASTLPFDSGRDAARDIHRALARYAASAWPFERGRAPPDEPRRAAMHRILTLDRGRRRSVAVIRRALAGLAQKSIDF